MAQSPHDPAAPRRRLRAVLIVGACAFVALMLVGWRTSWLSPRTYSPGADPSIGPIMPATGYEAVNATHARPYVVRADLAPGAVLIFGAEHSKNPQDPQFEQIRQQWRDYRPTVALVEGRPSGPFAGLRDPIASFGEGGLVRALARRDSVTCYTWEPSRADEVDSMLARFDRERVALMFVLRPYFSNYRHGRPTDPDAWIENVRARRMRWPGLEGALPSVEAIDTAWSRLNPDGPDWRDVSDEFGWPESLADLALYNRDLRTEHLARCAADLARRGERVFVICGSSHAVRVEPALIPTPPR